MRKILSAFVLAVCVSAPCQAASVVISIFPAYDWVREISKGVGHDLTLLLSNGSYLHSWQPSDVLGNYIKPEKIVEGMQHEHEEHEHTEPDEHIWLSLRNTEIICRKISALRQLYSSPKTR